MLLAFYDVSAQAGLAGVSGVGSVAFVDFDRDGALDLLAGSPDDGGTVLLENSDGHFSDITRVLFPGGAPGLLSLLCWDIDYDGTPEIIAASSRLGEPLILLKQRAGSFRDMAQDMGLSGGRSTKRALVLDADCDGRLDILELNTCLINEPGHRLWVWSGNTFTERTPESLRELSRDGFSGAVADLNNDFYPDIIVSQKEGGTFVLAGDGRGDGEVIYESEPGSDRGVMVGGYDLDGLYDIFICGDNGGVLLAHRGSDFKDVSDEVGLGSLPPLKDGAFSDLDLDGYDDLLLLTSEATLLVYMNEGGVFVNRTEAMGLDGFSEVKTFALGDYDGDGDPDLALVVSDGELRLAENTSGSGGFVKLRLQGAAPGDRASLYSGDFHKTLEVGASVNSLSQGAPELVFGTGNRESVDSVVVEWSCEEKRDVLEDVALNTVLEMRSPRFTPETEAEMAPDTNLRVVPNPAFGSAGFVYIVERPSEVELRIVESSGKTIKILDRGQKTPGTYWASWDGEDESGRKMPRGVYFVKLSTEGSSCQKKLIWFPY